MQTTLTKQPEPYRDLWGLVSLAGVGVLLAGLVLWLLSSPGGVGLDSGSAEQDPMAGMSQTAFTEATGVRILRVNSTAGGGMIDMRYQVVDPDKAVIVHDTKNQPSLLNEATEQAIDRPFHDHSSRSQLRAGATYNEILVNESGVIKPGDRVTIFIGQARLEHVVVQ